MFFTGEVRVFTESFALRAFTIPACHSHSQSTSVLLRAHVRGDPEKFLMFFVSKLTEHLRLLCLGKQDVSGFALATCYEYKKSPAKRVSLPRTNKQIIYPRCHLDSQLTLRRLAGYQHTPGNSRIPTRYRILRKIRFPVPSVVHLTSCFLPDSQHRGFSVKASLPLSPPQRFTIFSC